MEHASISVIRLAQRLLVDGGGIVCLLVLMTLLFFARVVISSDLMMGGDAALQFYPWLVYARSEIANGVFPLWNPYAFAGTPFAASPQVCLFYPFTWLLWLLPPAIALNYSIILHTALAAVGMYLFGKRLGLTPVPALLSGISFAFNSFFIGRLQQGHVDVLQTAAWFPWLFLVVHRIVERRAWSDVVLLSLVTAFLYLAGFVQLAYVAYILVGLYALFLLWINRRSKVTSIPVLGQLVTGAVLGIALAGVSVLPAFELIQQSNRELSLPYAFAARTSTPLESLMILVAPDLFGNPVDGTFWQPLWQPKYSYSYWSTGTYYLSIALLLAILALVFQSQNRQVRFFTAVALLSLLVAFGEHTPVYSLMYHLVPGYSRFGDPSLHLFFFAFSTAVLAGFGLAKLNEPALRLAIVVLGSLIGALALFSLLVVLFKPLLISFFASWLAYVPGSTFPTIASSLIRPTFVGAATLALLWLNKRLGQPLLQWSLVAIVSLDLWVFGTKFSYWPVKVDLVTSSQAVQQLISQDHSLYRIMWPADSNWQAGRLIGDDPVNYGSVEGLFHVSGNTPLILKSYAEFINLMAGRPTSSFWSYSVMNSDVVSGNQLRNLLNVKYLFSRDEIESQGLVLALDGKLKVYENEQVLPRAFLVHRAEVMGSQTAVADRLRDPLFPVEDIVLLEGTQPLDLEEAKGRTEDHVAITAYGANDIELTVSAGTDGILFLSEIYYPGWRAYVDGQETPVLRADYTFRAVYVKVGSHRVHFVYDPWTFKGGLALSLAAAVVLLALGIFALRHEKIGMRKGR